MMSRADSYDIIAEAVKRFWRATYPQDVVAFFSQKYSWENEWEWCEELVECHGADDYENMTFLTDFCEGQTDVKDVVITPLREVTALYSAIKLPEQRGEPQTNADRIRQMTDDALAALCSAPCPPGQICGRNMCYPLPECRECWWRWLESEDVPASDVAPVRHGRWIKDRRASLNGGWYEVFVCSECESAFNWRMRYCGHCGAKMDGGET